MTPKQAKEFRLIKEEINRLQGRADLTQECFQSHQSSLVNIMFQSGDEKLVEEHRDKATFYYESFLDLMIHIGKLTRKLSDLNKS